MLSIDKQAQYILIGLDIWQNNYTVKLGRRYNAQANIESQGVKVTQEWQRRKPASEAKWLGKKMSDQAKT